MRIIPTEPATVTQVRARLSAYLKIGKRRPVAITHKGRTVAVLLSVHDEEEAYRIGLSRNRKFQTMLEAARRRIEAGKGIPHVQFWREVDEESCARAKRGKTRGKSGKAG